MTYEGGGTWLHRPEPATIPEHPCRPPVDADGRPTGERWELWRCDCGKAWTIQPRGPWRRLRWIRTATRDRGRDASEWIDMGPL